MTRFPILLLVVLFGCGDDDGGLDAALDAATDGAMLDAPTFDSSTDAGTDAGPPPGDPCDEGAIGVECVCGSALYTEGFCCSDLWFDASYGELIGGCPDPSAYRYVDRDHAMASDSGGGTEDAPWATIEHGVTAIAPGQVLIVRAGTYAVTATGLRYDPALNPTSGTEGSPVIVKADGQVTITAAVVQSGTATGGTDGTIVLDDSASGEDQAYAMHFVRIASGTGAGQYRMILRDFDSLATTSYEGSTRTAYVNLDSDGIGNWDTAPDATSEYEITRAGPLIGTNGREHVVWDGFHVLEHDNYHPDTGSVVLWGSTDVALINCDIEAQTQLLLDNHNGLRIEGTDRALVRNNRIHGVQPIDVGRNNPQNHAAVMIYTSEDVVFEHNEVFDSFSGFFPKGGDSGHVIRFNDVHDVFKGVRISYHSNVRIYGNLLRDCTEAFQGSEENSSVRIYNNTVIGGERGLYNWFGINEVTFFNNIMSGVPAPVFAEAEPGNFAAHHNVFHDMTDFILNNRDVGGMEAWQGLGYGDGSVVADPGFVDADAGDYRLTESAAAAAIGVDLEDLDGDGDTSETIAAGAFVSGDERVGLRR